MTTIQLTDVEAALLRESITLSIEKAEELTEHPRYLSARQQQKRRIENLESIYNKLK